MHISYNRDRIPQALQWFFSIFVGDLNLISYSDIIELSEKLCSSSPGFFIRKLNPIRSNRVRHHWNSGSIPQINWWNIPYVRSRWNRLISEDPNIDYIKYTLYFLERHKKFNTKKASMLSIGCGTGSQELAFAQTGALEHIDAFDLAPNNIIEAQIASQKAQLESVLHFQVADFQSFKPNKPYDLILFHSSLHHLNPVLSALKKTASWLKPNGFLIVNEYAGPNRIQWNSDQLQLANRLLLTLPKELRTYPSGRLKTRQTAPGILRMHISDPSEAPDSQAIIPTLNTLFKQELFKGYGGNILAPLLKGISHHFIESNPKTKDILDMLFEEEDRFLFNHPSDHFVGIYSLKTRES